MLHNLKLSTEQIETALMAISAKLSELESSKLPSIGTAGRAHLVHKKIEDLLSVRDELRVVDLYNDRGEE